MLRLILRPRREQFSLELLSTTETVPVKTADSLLCGLPTVTGIMFRGKDVAVVIFLGNAVQTDISKHGQIKPKLSAWLETTRGSIFNYAV